MKKSFFISLLGFFAIISMTAANISVSPPVQEQSFIFEIQVIEKHYDVVLVTPEVEFVTQEVIQSNFDLNGVFAPEMRSGFVYHPMDYESNLVELASINKSNKHLSLLLEPRCRTDIFPAVSIPIYQLS